MLFGSLIENDAMDEKEHEIDELIEEATKRLKIDVLKEKHNES